MVQPIPIQRYLVPAQKLIAPEGFTQIDQPILRGLPHQISLNAEYTLLVVVPTGLAITWRDIDPTVTVSSSETERVSRVGQLTEEIASVKRSPARILVQHSGTTVASIPLALGWQHFISDNRTEMRMRLELMILGWEIRAGSMRGVGDFGSRILLAWRRYDRAINNYFTPPTNPYLIKRLEPSFRLESVPIPQLQRRPVEVNLR